MFVILKLYIKVTEEFLKFKSKYGNVSVFDTKTFLVGPKIGQELSIEISPGKMIYLKVNHVFCLFVYPVG